MKHNKMIPTSQLNSIRWVRHKLHSLYPYPHNDPHGDALASRWWYVSGSGFRMHPTALKRDIRRHLGYFAFDKNCTRKDKIGKT